MAPSPQPSLRPTFSQAPTAAPVPTVPPTKVTFYAIGDVPYSDAEACLLPFELQKMDPAGSFVIHLGDIRDARAPAGEISDCPESIFQDLSTIFESSEFTPFFTPGDNGWLDCANATEAYEYWEQYLFNYNERTDLSWSPFPANRWTSFPAGISRTTRRSEFVSFLLDNVLFIGVSLPASGRNEDNEWTPRDSLLQDGVQWTRENFDEYKDVMSAVVVFGHSSSDLNAEYFFGLRNIVRDPAYNGVPVLFLEEGGLVSDEEDFLNVPNLFLIETDDSVTPMKITVDPSASGGTRDIFQYSQTCICSNAHRPAQLITYVSSSPCGDVCNEGFEACKDEDRCSPEGAVCSGP